MTTLFYHGSRKPFPTLKVGSWLTRIPAYAIEQAKKSEENGSEAVYVLVVRVGGRDVRKPTNLDIADENMGNDSPNEPWVWISRTELRVLYCLTLKEAEETFCGAHNMLGSI
jgi:hypothetical protein